MILKRGINCTSHKETRTWSTIRVQRLCLLHPWICILTSFNASSHENQEREVSYLLTLGCTELSHVQVGLSSGRHFEYQFLKKLLPQRIFSQGVSVLNALWRCPVLISVAGRMSWQLVCHLSGSLEEFRDTKIIRPEWLLSSSFSIPTSLMTSLEPAIYNPSHWECR